MRKIQHTKLVTFIAFFIFFNTVAQKNTVFKDIQFHESFLDVQKKVQAISASSRIQQINTPSFPLSKYEEIHLIASKVQLNNEVIAKVVFTFSDDKLSYIQAQGNMQKAFISQRKTTPRTYLDYTVFESELLFINAQKDLAWQLTPESVHPNLFTWNNPYLTTQQEVVYNSSVAIPSFIKMGDDMNNLLPLLKANSSFINVQKLKDTKTQINCFGIAYAGFPRKFEARFEKNKLQMVWILTAKGEEDRLRKKLINTYGKALFINDKWEVFNNWTVMLRKDKPEVLLVTKELGQKYKQQYLNK